MKPISPLKFQKSLILRHRLLSLLNFDIPFLSPQLIQLNERLFVFHLNFACNVAFEANYIYSFAYFCYWMALEFFELRYNMSLFGLEKILVLQFAANM